MSNNRRNHNNKPAHITNVTTGDINISLTIGDVNVTGAEVNGNTVTAAIEEGVRKANAKKQKHYEDHKSNMIDVLERMIGSVESAEDSQMSWDAMAEYMDSLEDMFASAMRAYKKECRRTQLSV